MRQTVLKTRWLLKKDMSKILAIPNAWTEEDFDSFLFQSNSVGLVAEINNEIVGYMLYALDKTEFVLVNLCIAELFRRSGIGSQLVNSLTERLSAHRRVSVSCYVKESDLISQLFLKKLGFIAEIIKNHYDEEDAYYFTYKLKV